MAQRSCLAMCPCDAPRLSATASTTARIGPCARTNRPQGRVDIVHARLTARFGRGETAPPCEPRSSVRYGPPPQRFVVTNVRHADVIQDPTRGSSIHEEKHVQVVVARGTASTASIGEDA